MAELALSDEEIRVLIDYARQRFAKERWPLSPALRLVREIIEKRGATATPESLPPPKAWVNSSIGQRKRRARR